MKVKEENAGSVSASGSICQRHGSADPDPDPDTHHNVMDHQHCRELILESECRHPSSLGELNNTAYDDDDFPLRDSSLLLQGKWSLMLTMPVNIVVIFYKTV